MAQVTVSEKALRELVREALGSAHLGDLTMPEEPEAPVNVNPVVDPSAAETDITDPDFVPKSKQEFDVAVRLLVKDVPVDKVPSVYKAIEAFIDADEANSLEDDEMKKAKQGGTDQVEESLRKVVRNLLSEITPRFDMSYSGTEYGDSGDDDDDDDDTEKKPKRAYKSTAIGGMHDVGGATFEEIAKELGLSVAGAKRAVDEALKKLQFIAGGDAEGMEISDDVEILVLTTINDYIRMLSKKGDLSPADVQLLKDHPDIVRELDGFREFLHTAIKKARKGGKLEDPLGEAVEPGEEISMKSVAGKKDDKQAPAGSTTKAKGASGKNIEVDWGGFNEADNEDDFDPMPGASDSERTAYEKYASQGPPCPACGSEDTQPIDAPSMMSGEDSGVTCLGCQKTSWADPFTGRFRGPYAMKSESFVTEAKKKAAKKKAAAKKPVAKGKDKVDPKKKLKEAGDPFGAGYKPPQKGTKEYARRVKTFPNGGVGVLMWGVDGVGYVRARDEAEVQKLLAEPPQKSVR